MERRQKVPQALGLSQIVEHSPLFDWLLYATRDATFWERSREAKAKFKKMKRKIFSEIIIC